MEENKELNFRIMVTSPDILEKEIKNYNLFFETDFKIINIIDDDVPFCDIKVTKWKIQNIFGLGYSLAVLEDRSLIANIKCLIDWLMNWAQKKEEYMEKCKEN